MALITLQGPGRAAPAVGFEAPFEMLGACHERVQRMLRLLARLTAHVASQGSDTAARQAARDVMRYFDQAAPLHHQDEELHVFPALRAQGDAALQALVERLQQEHRQMAQQWAQLRTGLQRLADQADTQPADPAWRLPAPHLALQEAFSQLYQAHLLAEDGQAYPAAQARLTGPALQHMSQDMQARRGLR